MALGQAELLVIPGNRNNFASQKACQNYCLSEACPPGTVVAKVATLRLRNSIKIYSQESDGSRLQQCSNPGGSGRVSGGCPDGYSCYSSPLLDQNVCCGASTELQCEIDYSPVLVMDRLTIRRLQLCVRRRRCPSSRRSHCSRCSARRTSMARALVRFAN